METCVAFGCRNLRFLSPTVGEAAAVVETSEAVLLEEIDVFGGKGNGSSCGQYERVAAQYFGGNVADQRVFAKVRSTRLEYGPSGQRVHRFRFATTRERQQSGLRGIDVSVSNCALGAFGLRVPVYEIRGNLAAN
jgi:hypothetical protein